MFVILLVCLRAQSIAGLGACRDSLDVVAAGAITPRLGLFLITAVLTVFWTVGAHWIGGLLGFQLTEEALSSVAAVVIAASLIIFRPIMAQKQWADLSNG